MAKAPRDNRIPIMMSHDELTAIDDWRFANRVATRSDAIRRLAQMALAVQPLIMGDAMDQAEQIAEAINATQNEFFELRKAVRAGLFAETATPENILDDVSAELREISDQAYWLQLQLLEVNNMMFDIAGSPHALAKRKARKTREVIDVDRDKLLSGREEGYDNMILFAVTNAMTPEQRAAYDDMDEEAQESFLDARTAAVKKRLEDEMGLTSAYRLYDNSRGVYLYDYEKMNEIVRQEVSK